MLVKALTSFGGKISMGAGEVREILDEEIAKDLLRAGHVVEAKAEKEAEKGKKDKKDQAVEVDNVEIKDENPDGTVEAVVDGKEETLKPADKQTAEAVKKK